MIKTSNNANEKGYCYKYFDMLTLQQQLGMPVYSDGLPAGYKPSFGGKKKKKKKKRKRKKE